VRIRHIKCDADPVDIGQNSRNRIGGRAGDWLSMSKDELVIQLIKIGLGFLIAGYFLWWSLEVLKRLPPVH